MAYVPAHDQDVFLSYCHDDDFEWIRQFHDDLSRELNNHLRSRLEAAIFFDKQDIRAGYKLSAQIPGCLPKTGFFVAMISRKYRASTYCSQIELNKFWQLRGETTGRIIQVRIDDQVPLALPDLACVDFAKQGRRFMTRTPEYEDALRKVWEPIAAELDRLFAQSKLVFFAWSDSEAIQAERTSLQIEIERKGIRVYPEAVAEYTSDVELRKALQDSSMSVHFLQEEPAAFELRQLEMARHVGRPCVIASLNPAERERGPAGSPAPIYLAQGNPNVSIANAIDDLLGRGKQDLRSTLGRRGLFFVFQQEADASLGIKVRQQILNSGPFYVIDAPPSVGGDDRYDALTQSTAAILCRGRAELKWLTDEFDGLSQAMARRGLYELRRGLYFSPPEPQAAVELASTDQILNSTEELKGFLAQLQ